MAAANRVEESSGANTLSSYFAPDVQNTIAVATGVSESSAACGGSALATPGLLLTTHTPTTEDASFSTVFYYRGTGAKQSTLYRRVCSGGTASAPVRLVHNLSGAPIFSCGDAAGGTDCGNFRTVKVVVQQQKTPGIGAPFTSTVEAARRDL
jgi:hypothetical protein